MLNSINRVVVLAACALAPGLASAQVVDAVNLGLRGLATVMSSIGRTGPTNASITSAATDRSSIERQIDEALKNVPEAERAERREAALKQVDAALALVNDARRGAVLASESGRQTPGDIIRNAIVGAPIGSAAAAHALSTPAGQVAAKLIAGMPTTSTGPMVIHQAEMQAAAIAEDQKKKEQREKKSVDLAEEKKDNEEKAE